MELVILYEDNDIIVCHKPAGVATQTRRLGQKDMESELKNYRARKGEEPYIGIVHRLDQPVEGVMVFAKNKKSAAGLSTQIQNRMIGKHYYAVSTCAPEQTQGVLEDYLLTDKKTNVTSIVDEKTTGGKRAKLAYAVKAAAGEKTLFDIQLYTGRQHQIRVQMAHMGCPLAGDTKYNVACTQTMKNGGLALCSYRLEFRHPMTEKDMDFSIDPTGDGFAAFFPKNNA